MKFWILALYVSTTLFIVSCGSDGGEDTFTPSSSINVEGLWSITETNIEGCPEWELEQYDLRLISYVL